MKDEEALRIIQRFRELCEQSMGSGEFTEDAYDEIIKGCDELRKNGQYKAWGNALIRMIEDYEDEVDLSAGYPGYFGHALESGGLEASCKLYVESVNRKPTGLIVGLAGRAYHTGDGDCGFGLELFQSVLKHPLANIGAKECAELELEL